MGACEPRAEATPDENAYATASELDEWESIDAPIGDDVLIWLAEQDVIRPVEPPAAAVEPVAACPSPFEASYDPTADQTRKRRRQAKPPKQAAADAKRRRLERLHTINLDVLQVQYRKLRSKARKAKTAAQKTRLDELALEMGYILAVREAAAPPDTRAPCNHASCRRANLPTCGHLTGPGQDSGPSLPADLGAALTSSPAAGRPVVSTQAPL